MWRNGVKYILAFCAGSQSLSQLESNYRVFAMQLLPKLITELALLCSDPCALSYWHRNNKYVFFLSVPDVQ